MLRAILKASALASALTIASFGAANAQSKWTGISIGVGAGAGSVNHELTIGPGPALPPGFFAFALDGIGGEGMFGTAGIAADFQVSDRLVMGVFFDYDFAKLKSEINLSVPPPWRASMYMAR